MMDGKADKAVRSEIHSLEASGVSSEVWVWDRAGHEEQGSSCRQEHPVNLSRVLAADIRYCQIKTMPCVERKSYKNHTMGLSLLCSECSGLAKMGSGLYRRGQAMREGESLWSPIICDHQMKQVDMPG
jgi:hypothetical protein